MNVVIHIINNFASAAAICITGAMNAIVVDPSSIVKVHREATKIETNEPCLDAYAPQSASSP